MILDLAQIAVIALIGLAAGLLGGLAGIGGSMVMIPGLVLVLGYRDESHSEQHLYMASAMVVNALVAYPAAARHAKSGAVRWDLFRVLLPAMIASILVGVLLSNLVDGSRLRDLLALFIALYCLFNLVRVFARQTDFDVEREHATRARLVTCALLAGLVSGLLGLGGGVVLVPLLQMICRVRLRKAIGTTLAVMPASAIVGSTTKLATLSSHGQTLSDALILVLVMAPLAMLGGHLGATLAHKLPLKIVRLLILSLMLIVAMKLAEII